MAGVDRCGSPGAGGYFVPPEPHTCSINYSCLLPTIKPGSSIRRQAKAGPEGQGDVPLRVARAMRPRAQPLPSKEKGLQPPWAPRH